MKARVYQLRDMRPIARRLPVVGQARRPQTRAECESGPRPCPYVSCRYHLYLDVLVSGSLKLNHPDKDPDELEETCALDVAERGGESMTVIGRHLSMSRQRVEQIEKKAARKLAMVGGIWFEDWRAK